MQSPALEKGIGINSVASLLRVDFDNEVFLVDWDVCELSGLVGSSAEEGEEEENTENSKDDVVSVLLPNTLLVLLLNKGLHSLIHFVLGLFLSFSGLFFFGESVLFFLSGELSHTVGLFLVNAGSLTLSH